MMPDLGARFRGHDNPYAIALLAIAPSNSATHCIVRCSFSASVIGLDRKALIH